MTVASRVMAEKWKYLGQARRGEIGQHCVAANYGRAKLGQVLSEGEGSQPMRLEESISIRSFCNAVANYILCFGVRALVGGTYRTGSSVPAMTASTFSQLGMRAQLVGRQQRASRSHTQELVAFTGFRRRGAVDAVGSAPQSLQAAVRKAISAAASKSGVRCVRVTRMMFERFTEKAIKVVMLAQEEARRLGHNFVGTEQILLGLIGESTGK